MRPQDSRQTFEKKNKKQQIITYPNQDRTNFLGLPKAGLSLWFVDVWLACADCATEVSRVRSAIAEEISLGKYIMTLNILTLGGVVTGFARSRW